MSLDESEKSASESLNRFMDQLSRRSDREIAALNVVRMLGTFLQDGGEIPRDLALSIGGCLEDFVDIDGNTSDPDLQLLFKQVLKRSGW